MTTDTDVERGVTRTTERIALVALIALAILSAGLALVLGPVLLFFVFLFALGALAVDQLAIREDARKDAELEMEDRITLSLQSDSAKLQKAIDTHKTYICSETLATDFSPGLLHGANVFSTTVGP